MENTINTKVQELMTAANEIAWKDYHINAGAERKASSKVWEKEGQKRTYITIQCFTANGKFKGSYDCGYVDHTDGQYKTANRTEVDLENVKWIGR